MSPLQLVKTGALLNCTLPLTITITITITITDALFDYAIDNYNVDVDRIYIGGFSSGSLMSWQMAKGSFTVVGIRTSYCNAKYIYKNKKSKRKIQ